MKVTLEASVIGTVQGSYLGTLTIQQGDGTKDPGDVDWGTEGCLFEITLDCDDDADIYAMSIAGFERRIDVTWNSPDPLYMSDGLATRMSARPTTSFDIAAICGPAILDAAQRGALPPRIAGMCKVSTDCRVDVFKEFMEGVKKWLDY